MWRIKLLPMKPAPPVISYFILCSLMQSFNRASVPVQVPSHRVSQSNQEVTGIRQDSYGHRVELECLQKTESLFRLL